MSAELKMPALSPTMEKGTLAKWLVKEGDVVNVGDLIAEIETDKATMDFEATDTGTIGSILIAEGTEDVPVGAVVALFTDVAGRPAELTPAAPPIAVAPKIEAAVAVAKIHETAPAPPAGERPATVAAVPLATNIKVSPLARRIAAAKGVDLAAVTGSGPHGKIMKADLNLPTHGAATRATSAPASIIVCEPPVGVPYEALKLSGMRKTIARRLSEAKQTVPHFHLSVDLKIDDLLGVREQLNAGLAERGVKLSINDFLIKALGIALEQVPNANVQFAADELYRFGRVDVSMAVAVPGGLVTPVIHDVANKRLSQIAEASKDLAAKARTGKLMLEDYQGGTVSISNLGMYGMKTIIPVINPPQCLILGVGAAEERPISINGEIVVATLLSVTASFDHRAVDGAVGAQFLQAFKRIAEHPIEMFA
jgi:pyruvate dehydrogenase E2 component (dihydrolipoamide acetyltransferase)